MGKFNGASERARTTDLLITNQRAWSFMTFGTPGSAFFHPLRGPGPRIPGDHRAAQAHPGRAGGPAEAAQVHTASDPSLEGLSWPGRARGDREILGDDKSGMIHVALTDGRSFLTSIRIREYPSLMNDEEKLTCSSST